MGNQCCSHCKEGPGKEIGADPPKLPVINTEDREMRKQREKNAAVKITALWKSAKTKREVFDKRQGHIVPEFPSAKPRPVAEKENELGPYRMPELNFLSARTQKIYKIDENTFYQGYWLHGMRNKLGIEVKADGSTYEGGFQDDKYHGKGRKIFSDGSYYEGDWQEGSRHGEGVFVDVYKAKYTGGWKFDKKDGKCTEEWPEGEIFQGYYKDGRKNGQGEFKWKNGSKYSGEFRDDCMHGRGLYVWNNGNKYSGDWKDNMMDGNGTFENDSGVYVGDFKRDLKHGTGEFTDREHRRYVGQWQEGKRHGRGTVYTRDEQRNGVWERGQRRYWLNADGTPSVANAEAQNLQ